MRQSEPAGRCLLCPRGEPPWGVSPSPMFMAIPASVSTGTAREGGKGIASEENNVWPAGRCL